MRLKVVVFTLVFACFSIAGLVYLGLPRSSSVNEVVESHQPVESAASTKSPRVRSLGHQIPVVQESIKQTPITPQSEEVAIREEVKVDYAATRVTELEKAANETHPYYMRLILAEINNPDPIIKQTARDAIVDFGNRDAIPELEKLAEETSDPREKVKILDLVEYLRLPTLTELKNKQTTAASENALDETFP